MATIFGLPNTISNKYIIAVTIRCLCLMKAFQMCLENSYYIVDSKDSLHKYLEQVKDA